MGLRFASVASFDRHCRRTFVTQCGWQALPTLKKVNVVLTCRHSFMARDASGKNRAMQGTVGEGKAQRSVAGYRPLFFAMRSICPVGAHCASNRVAILPPRRF